MKSNFLSSKNCFCFFLSFLFFISINSSLYFQDQVLRQAPAVANMSSKALVKEEASPGRQDEQKEEKIEEEGQLSDVSVPEEQTVVSVQEEMTSEEAAPVGEDKEQISDPTSEDASTEEAVAENTETQEEATPDDVSASEEQASEPVAEETEELVAEKITQEVLRQAPDFASSYAKATEDKKASPDKQDERKEEKVEEDITVEEEGPETVTLSEEKIGFRGNWVKKREWLLKAKEQNTKIQDLADKLDSARDPFWDKFKKIQEEIDEFYKYAGRVQGKLELVYKYQEEIKERKEEALKEEESVKIEAQKAKKEKGFFSRVIDSLFDAVGWTFNKVTSIFGGGKQEVKLDKALEMQKIRLEKKAKKNKQVLDEFEEEGPSELEQFKSGVAKVREFDEGLVKRMEKLDQQLDMVVVESKRARGLLNEIWDIIDDKKARINFYEMKAIFQKIKSLQDYLSGEFASDFDATIELLNKQKEKVISKAKSFEDEGFVEKEGYQEESQENVNNSLPEKIEEKSIVEKKTEVEDAWYSKIWTNVKNFSSSLWQKLFGEKDKPIPPRAFDFANTSSKVLTNGEVSPDRQDERKEMVKEEEAMMPPAHPEE